MSLARLKIIETGAKTSLQDGGRFGFQAYGVGPSGASDKASLAIANTLVGNPATACAIEFTQLGGTFELLEGELLIALVGGASLEIDGVKAAPFTSHHVKATQKFKISHIKQGTYAYLSLNGRFETPQELGSLSFHARAGLGKALSEGEVMRLHTKAQEPLTLPPFTHEKLLRVVLGPQDDYFSQKTIEKFLNSEWAISALADRMGVRLEGEILTHTGGFNIVSDGIATGAIQVPGNGVPIVLLADRQTTGGYPKIATLLSCDLPYFTQMQAGEKLKFQAVSQSEGILLTRQWHERFQNYLAEAKPLAQELTSEWLLKHNLIDGFI